MQEPLNIFVLVFDFSKEGKRIEVSHSFWFFLKKIGANYET